jgi:hypothetical protein
MQHDVTACLVGHVTVCLRGHVTRDYRTPLHLSRLQAPALQRHSSDPGPRVKPPERAPRGHAVAPRRSRTAPADLIHPTRPGNPQALFGASKQRYPSQCGRDRIVREELS